MSKTIKHHEEAEAIRDKIITAIDRFVTNIELLEKWLSK